MDNYRDLNKELVEQVQAMRVNMKLYCDEIVHLKAELMQKHEYEVILRKQCYNWAIENFLKLIQTVQPDADIVPLLKEYNIQQERILSSNRFVGQRISNGSSENTRTRSSQLSMELRRSVSVINARKSICSTSPIRRSNESNAEESAYENRNEDDEQKEEYTEEVVDDLPHTETPKEILQQSETNHIIYEESEEDDEADHIPNSNEESNYESVEEITVDITHTRSTLKDVTNILDKITDSSMDNSYLYISKKPTNATRQPTRNRRQTNKRKTKNIMEDTTDSCDMSIVESDKEENLKNSINRPSKNRSTSTDHSVAEIEEDTLQEPRRNSRTKEPEMTNKSIPIALNYNSCAEATIASPSIAYSDLTLGNFRNAACSTPNSRRNSLSKPSLPSTMSSSVPTIESASASASINTSTRPRRQCKPKNLAEPSMKTKLRNETTTTKGSKRRK